MGGLIGAMGGFGPVAGDPVNIANLQEEYEPGADMTIYNPNGPAIVWSRIYGSMRGDDIAYQDTDYGNGWSHPYNVMVQEPNLVSGGTPASGDAPASSTTDLSITGSDAPMTSGVTWEIDLSGSVVATSATPNGWNVYLISTSGTVTAIAVVVPLDAALGGGYEVRATSGASSGSGSGGGFGGGPSSGGGTGGTGSGGSGSSGPYSAPFTVVPPDEIPSATGTKYLVFQNGGRVAFTLTGGALPTSGTPTVSCSIGAGYPLLIQCHYDTTIDQCYYTVTFMDQTQWTLYPAVYTAAGQLLYCLTNLQDRLGNGLNLLYGAPSDTVEMFMTGGIPLLSSIQCASTGGTLLTFVRDDNGCIVELQDCYSRSVYYANTTLYSTGGYGPYPHNLLTQVSQISATGTGSGSAAMRYEYDYTNVYNGTDGTGLMLSTITVPSPTGTGTSTATLTYQAYTGYVSTITDANGNVTTFTPCSADGTPVSGGGSLSGSSSGGIGTNPYTSSNYTLVTVANSEGTVVYSTIGGFDGNMSEVSWTDGAGNVKMSRTFASPSNPFRPDSATDGNGRTAYYTWDTYGNMLSSTSARGMVTSYTLNYSSFSLGRLTGVQAGSKSAVTYTYYEPTGLLETESQPVPGTSGSTSSVITSYTYDSLGNVVEIVAPGNNASISITSTFSYTTDGSYSQAAAIMQFIAVTDGAGNSVHCRFDEQGRLISGWDALGNVGARTLNLSGQVLTEVFPATGETGPGQGYVLKAYQYDGGPLSTMKLYDESGTLIRQVTYTYGAEGELLSVSGSTEPVAYTYDAVYRRVSLSDGNSNVTEYTFNTAGYLSQITYPGSSGSGHFDTVQFTSYNASGQLLQRIDGNNVTTNYVYGDTAGALSAIEYPATTGRNAAFSYDEYGRLESKSDGEGSYTYSFDDGDRLTSVVTTYSGLSAQTVSYSFYADGSRSGMSTPAGNFSYSYDSAGRSVSLTNPFSETSSWSWLNNNWLSSQTLANGTVSSYGYDALGRLTSLINQFGSGTSATTLSQYGSFSYDGASNRTGVSASMPAVTALDGTVTYSYDSKDQLTAESSSRGSGISTTFGFDSAGNPTTFQSSTRSFNSDNQLTSTGMSYDGNGNPTNYGGTSMTFDAENKLTVAGTAMTAGYTIEGLRAWKQNTSSGVRTYFLYDGTTPVIELTSSGTVSATNTFSALGLLSRNVSGNNSIFYTFDERGNVAQRLSSSGSILSTDLYSAFGTLLAGGGDVFGFGAKSGYYADLETSLVLCGMRYYDAGAGRWLTRDPIGYRGGVNLYSYCFNSSTNDLDPMGTLSLPTVPIPGLGQWGNGAGGGVGAALKLFCAMIKSILANHFHLDACIVAQIGLLCDTLNIGITVVTCMLTGGIMSPWCLICIALQFITMYFDAEGETEKCCPWNDPTFTQGI